MQQKLLNRRVYFNFEIPFSVNYSQKSWWEVRRGSCDHGSMGPWNPGLGLGPCKRSATELTMMRNLLLFKESIFFSFFFKRSISILLFLGKSILYATGKSSAEDDLLVYLRKKRACWSRWRKVQSLQNLLYKVASAPAHNLIVMIYEWEEWLRHEQISWEGIKVE